jgi:acyl CoA:acetate/3-ketoacid CoA transferase
MSKIVNASEAVSVVEDGDTVLVVGAGGGLLEPDELLRALGQRYTETGHPRDLTIVYAAGLGDWKTARGLAPVAQRGMVKRVIGGHWGDCPPLAQMAADEEIEAYNISLGVLNLLHREIAGGRPGLITDIGIGTFVDPRIEGGRMNRSAKDDLVEVIEVAGREYLFYKAYQVDVALVRGWSADRDGYTSLVGETMWLDTLAAAMAARACGGKTIVQVKNVVDSAELNPWEVKVPGILVDAVVHHPDQWQSYESEFDPVYAGQQRVVLADRAPAPLDVRTVIGRRAALLLRPGAVVNLGVGVPDRVGGVIAEEGLEEEVTLTTEHGVVGGVPATGVIFGASSNFRALIDGPDMINLYHGGCLDYAFLGFAEVDQAGNVNASKFNGIIMGSGGFVDIAQSARILVLCGTFTASGLDVCVEEGHLDIRREGKIRKFVESVEQITVSGRDLLARGHKVYVVTERALFELRSEGLVLLEAAPGVDVERDVISRMGFAPLVDDPVGTMEQAIFDPAPMGLAKHWAKNVTAMTA